MIRVGIDVGGTFTHAVAVDGDKFEVIAHTVVPTTHRAPEGVARGIVGAVQKLLQDNQIDPVTVAFIAHSTTQATNAMLEGDVVQVGIVAAGTGLEGSKAKADTRVGSIELAPGRNLTSHHRYVDIGAAQATAAAQAALRSLAAEGARVIVAAAPFSVDDPTHETHIAELAAGEGLPATCTHEISKLYGLRVRTRTAVLNASILPKMIESVNMTEQSVREAGITAPLMIMRGDGGVMDAAEVRRRPILTMLSGPAAGVAGALMFGRISDEIFLEVGGTSTDISVIRNGKVMVKYAEVGGHKTYLHSLDTRTLGVAGGSMIRLDKGRVVDVGPRSAHIAGFPYAVYAPPEGLAGAKLVSVQPRPGDPADYVVLEALDGRRFALTTTCAGHLTGGIGPGDYSYGNSESAQIGFDLLGQALGKSAREAAEATLKTATAKVVAQVNTLIEEYKLDSRSVVLVGGGGGASAIVPFTAQTMGLRNALVPGHEVISAIGVALAMVRETIQRTIINPTQEDILRLRKEAETSLLRMGAAPETVDIFIEVDSSRNIVTATATGATELRARGPLDELDADALHKVAADSMGTVLKDTALAAQTEFLYVFEGTRMERSLFGLLKKKVSMFRVVDRLGTVRLQGSGGLINPAAAREAPGQLRALIERETGYGDGGKRLPATFVLHGAKVLDLSGVTDPEQVSALAEVEWQGLAPEAPVVLIAVPKDGI